MWSLSARGLKIKGLVFFVLFGGLFLINTQSAAAQCWTDYPKVGGADQPLSGVVAADIVGRSCEADGAACTAKGGSWVFPNKGPLGCSGTSVCCIQLKDLGECYDNYVGSDRPNIEKTQCFPTAAQCSGSNKNLGLGYGCPKTGTPSADQVCCAIIKSTSASGSTPAASGPLPAGGSTAEWKSGVPGGVQLVPCTQTGDCEIADLVQQAVNFARWLMGLAGALFLLVFVYGGAMYVMSFGRSDMVTKGKTALTRGAIGVVLVMGAWTIVTYVADSLGYAKVSIPATPSTSPTETCAGDPAFAGQCTAGKATDPATTQGTTPGICSSFCGTQWTAAGKPPAADHPCTNAGVMDCGTGKVCCRWKK
ncbi:MAG TPA: pilin [bacterium]|nr:MAG: hypothetical protein BWY14_00974 [Parcubacteria group bacterium ADurb.Bin192]HPN15484.1 pilin [bacterium]